MPTLVNKQTIHFSRKDPKATEEEMVITIHDYLWHLGFEDLQLVFATCMLEARVLTGLEVSIWKFFGLQYVTFSVSAATSSTIERFMQQLQKNCRLNEDWSRRTDKIST